MALNDRQRAFVREYLIDGNATAAYRRAGYKAANDNVAAVSGHQLLTLPKIQEALEEFRSAVAEIAKLTAAEVIDGLRREASREGEGSSHGARVAALSWLGKHLAMFVERSEVDMGVRVEVAEELVDAADGHHSTNGKAPPRATALPPE